MFTIVSVGNDCFVLEFKYNGIFLFFSYKG